MNQSKLNVVSNPEVILVLPHATSANFKMKSLFKAESVRLEDYQWIRLFCSVRTIII